MKSYPAYKHSGVPWLGEIPEHWGTIYPKALFAQRKDRAEKGMRQLTASQNHGVIYQDDYMKLTGSRVVTVMKDFDILKRVEAGDFVISMRSFQGGLEYSNLSGSISSAYVMLTPRTGLVHAPFFKWLFKSYGYIKALQSTSNLVRDGQAMRYANFIQVRLPLVPLDEQAAIASYLDRKCGEIDEMVRRRQAIIERLRELKQALIAKAVTKGLHPDVPMKDSGIPWLGQIPEGWEMRPIKRIFSEVDKKKGDLSYPLLSFSKEKGLVISSEDRKGVPDDLSNYKILKKGQLLENRMQAWNGMFICADKDGCVSPDYSVFETINTGTASVKFYEYVFRNHIWVKQFANASKGIGTGFNRLYTPQFGAIKTVYPPYKEQAAIVAYLDKKCAAIDELISRHGQIVEKLKELKASAIAHVVTGKIDIREGA